MNQIFEGTTKVDGTPYGLDQGYIHVGSSQAPNIEKDLPNDDTNRSQAKSVWGNFLSVYSQFYELIILGGTYAIDEGKIQSVFLNIKLCL